MEKTKDVGEFVKIIRMEIRSDGRVVDIFIPCCDNPEHKETVLHVEQDIGILADMEVIVKLEEHLSAYKRNPRLGVQAEIFYEDGKIPDKMPPVRFSNWWNDFLLAQIYKISSMRGAPQSLPEAW